MTECFRIQTKQGGVWTTRQIYHDPDDFRRARVVADEATLSGGYEGVRIIEPYQHVETGKQHYRMKYRPSGLSDSPSDIEPIPGTTGGGEDVLLGEPDQPDVDMGSFQKVHWFRRTVAFTVDVLILAIVWGFIDSNVLVLVPSFVMELASVVLFCAYYGVFEGVGVRKASPGKRLLGISVRHRGKSNPSIWDVTLRSAVVAALAWMNWTLVVGEVIPVIPYVLMVVTAAVFGGMAFYSGLLCIMDKHGVMFHDNITGTIVGRRSEIVATGDMIPALPLIRVRFPRPVICAAVIVVAVAGVFSMQALLGTLSWESAQGLRQMEAQIRETQGIRNAISAELLVTSHFNGEPSTRSLNITVKVPSVGMDTDLGRADHKNGPKQPVG